MVIQTKLPKELESVKSNLENKINGSSSKLMDVVNQNDITEDSRSVRSVSKSIILVNNGSIKDITGEEKDVVHTLESSKKATSEYISYLLLCQKHSSSNFIHKIDSKEILWNDESIVVKMIGPYILGDSIGKGSFGKVKEGICSETLQRVAIKIIK